MNEYDENDEETSEPFKLEFAPANDRGFLRADFKDRNGEDCSIQESSIVMPHCIWLGQNEGSHIERQGKEYCLARMHLTRDMARTLGAVLLHFAETGEIGDPGK